MIPSSLRPKQKLQFDQEWPAVEEKLRQILQRPKCPTQKSETTSISFMELYQTVYDLCNAYPKPFIRQLMFNLRSLLEDNCSQCLRTIKETECIGTDHGGSLIEIYSLEWQHFQKTAQCLNFIFGYLNRLLLSDDQHFYKRYFGASNDAFYPRKTCVEAICYLVWRQTVVLGLIENVFENNSTPNGNLLTKHLIFAVDRDRRGQYLSASESQNIRQAVESFVALNSFVVEQQHQLYYDVFEEPFLRNTKKFFETESQKSISSASHISVYIEHVEVRLNEERIRSMKFCNQISTDKILRACEFELIYRHLPLFHEEFISSLKTGNRAQLHRCYTLLGLIQDGLQGVAEKFEEFISEQGRKELRQRLGVTTDASDFQTCISCIIEMHSRFMEIVQDVLKSDFLFSSALDKGFRSIINDGSVRVNIAEVLGKAADMLLKKSQKIPMTECDLHKRLGEIMLVFKYVDNKDFFQKYYSRMLAKRLIYGTYCSLDAEEFMISHLKGACGVEYGGKLQKMFTDMKLSADLTSEYAQKEGQMETSFNILTSSSWPFSASSQTGTFLLPKCLQETIQSFTDFYSTKFVGRKLSWLHNLGRVDLKILGFDKRYEFSVSVSQAALLLAFNEYFGPVTSSNLISITGIPTENEVRSSLNPLVENSLLQFTGDTYAINENFSSKRLKIKVSATGQQESTVAAQRETEQVKQAVNEDRRFFLQAAIVRVMKAKKECSHNQLIQEVVELCRGHFQPEIGTIKKSIEYLLDKQYLERSSSNDKYVYVA